MKKSQATEFFKGLAQQATNRLADWGVSEARLEIVDCHNSDGLHVQVFHDDDLVVEFHIWDVGDDYSEQLYENAFYRLCLSLYMADRTYKTIKSMVSAINPFNEFKPPYHGGLLN